MSTVLLLALMAGAGLLGYIVGRRNLDDRDPGWLPPERRRWRP